MSREASPELEIEGKRLGLAHPTYFVADIAANHDGDLARAKDLIHLAAESGAQAAKFQHFAAQTIVSDYGFRNLGAQRSHQAGWKKSVFEVYQDASLNPEWTPALAETCRAAGITFFTSPYSCELVDEVDPYVPAFKIGSGDITWPEIMRHIAAKQKPVLLATGASTMDDVRRAVECISKVNPRLVLMQCNTNYTASLENFHYVELRVLESYRKAFPGMILGLSDHTPGHATVLGAIALGARVIEKHFTDDRRRSGPDHAFSMDPQGWREMVDRSRELQSALGEGMKRVEENEKETCVLQRRAIRAREALKAGTRLKAEHFIMLRPCPADGLAPYLLDECIGRTLKRSLVSGEHLKSDDLA